jgi:hypothetical protein
VDGDVNGAAAAWQAADPTALDAGDRRLLGIYHADALAMQGDAARASEP